MKKLIFSILLLASTLLQASDIYVKPGEVSQMLFGRRVSFVV